MTEKPPARTRHASPPVRQVRPRGTDATPGTAGTADRGVASAPTTDVTPASIGKRVGAYIIDYLAVNVALVVVAARSGLLSPTTEVMSQDQAYIAGVLSSAVALLYFTLLEAAFGQTLAKRLLGIKVVLTDGTRATVRAALTRRVLFVAGMVVPLVGALFAFAVPLAALVTAIQDELLCRGFHDRWAGTLVIEA